MHSWELYRRWESQHWSAHAIDLTNDRQEWATLADAERKQWYWLAGFSHFRQSELHGVVCLSKLLPLLHRPEEQHYLSTQIADEGRHAYFFERYHAETLAVAVPEIPAIVASEAYRFLFLDGLSESVRLAVAKRTVEGLACAAFHTFILLEGSVAMSSMYMLRKLLTVTGRFPGLLQGISGIERDEVRHAQFGMVVLQGLFAEMPHARQAVEDYWRTLAPKFETLLTPQNERSTILAAFGIDPDERRERARSLLRRQLHTLEIAA